MSSIDIDEAGRESARQPLPDTALPARVIDVWDPLVRLIHWSLALAILLDGFVLEENLLHEWVGYAALGLVAVRLVWGLVGSAPARFSAFPPSPAAAFRHLRAILSGDRSAHLSHNPLGALMAYNLWLSVLAVCATGVMMTTTAWFGVEWVEEAHEAAFAWVMASVALHLIGVALDTRRTGVGLVRAMVDGRKRVPAGVRVE